MKNKKDIILKLYNDYKQIENMRDIVWRGLTLSDYNSLLNVINELAVHHKSEFFILNIANYLKKFNVKIKTSATNYIATI
jgi:hypothetical protein